MSLRVIRNPNHRCPIDQVPRRGAVVQCDACGQVYKAFDTGSISTSKWVPVNKLWAFLRGWN